MIEIQNLRLEQVGEWTRLVADISSDFKREDDETTMWVGVKNEHKDLLSDENYNAFMFLPVYMSMYYKSDLRIHGHVSKTLWRNMQKYVQSIILDFKDGLKRIKIVPDGFREVSRKGTLNGTGVSCGIDSLQTIYDNYVVEKDPEYRLGALFMFNCGWHGKYSDPNTFKTFMARSDKNRKACDEMGLPLIEVDSNLHAFLAKLGDQISYFKLYTCAFAMEGALRRYYISSSYSYRDSIEYGAQSRNRDWSEFGDATALPLMHSERMELVSDGCQYTRTQKTERIADWDIAQKYLNVCCRKNAIENCSVCQKYVRTLLALEAAGKLEQFAGVFDLDAYKKISHYQKCTVVHRRNSKQDGFRRDIYRFYQKKGVALPSPAEAELCLAKKKITGVLKKS